MIGVYICATVMLTLVWGILSESFSLYIMLSGLLVSICCVLFTRKFLPLYKVSGTSFIRLIFYPFYLLGQIYLSALSNIKIILTDSCAEITTVNTKIKSVFLKILLSHSITLTPGTVSLDLNDSNLTVLYLSSKRARLREGTGEALNAAQLNIAKMEKHLLRAQKQ